VWLVQTMVNVNGAGENYHAVENPMQKRNRNIISGGAVIRKVVIEDKDIN